MANVLIEESVLQGWADTIREKTGAIDAMLPTVMLTKTQEEWGASSGGSEDAERTVVLKETILTFFPEQSLGLYMATNVPLFELEEGETYTALWAGTEYVCTAETASQGEITAVAIGNKAMLGLGENTGEPFIIYYIPDQQVSSMLSMDTEETDRAVAIYRGQEGSESSDSELDIDQINKIIELLFDDGDMVVKAPYGQLYKTVTINKPDTLVPENIVKDVDIAGVIGTYSGGSTNNDIDGVISKSIVTLESNVTSFGDGFFKEFLALETVSFPLATSVSKSGFIYCSALKSAYFPVATSINDEGFYGCGALLTVDAPLVTSIGNSAFFSCSKLETVSFPLVTTISNATFQYCYALKSACFPIVTSIGALAFSYNSIATIMDFPSVMSIGARAFYCCSKLRSLILRSETMCEISSSNIFDSCYVMNGEYHYANNPNSLKGYIYVPSALVETYKGATNWSTYASQFRALEDYTVDGTITGALDETKI